MLKHAPRSAHPNAYFRLFTCIIKSKKGVVSVSFDLILTGSAKSRGLSSFADENCYILGYIHWSNPHSEWCSNINVSPFLIVEDPHCLMMNCYHFPHLMWKIQHFTIFGGDNSQNWTFPTISLDKGRASDLPHKVAALAGETSGQSGARAGRSFAAPEICQVCQVSFHRC